MDNKLNVIVSTEGNQNLSQATQVAEKYDQVVFENASFLEMTDDEKIDIVATHILKRFKPAFEELAK